MKHTKYKILTVQLYMSLPGHVEQHPPGGGGSGLGQGGRRHSTALQSTVGGTVGRGGFVGAGGKHARDVVKTRFAK